MTDKPDDKPILLTEHKTTATRGVSPLPSIIAFLVTLGLAFAMFGGTLSAPMEHQEDRPYPPGYVR